MIDSKPVKVKVTGFEDLIDGFEVLGEKEVLAALDATMEDVVGVVGRKAQQNFRTAVPTQARIYEQLRWRHYVSTKKQYNVYGQVGYFTIPAVDAKYSDTPNKEIPAPVVGYWLEFGVQPHSLAPQSRAATRTTPNGSARPGKGQDKLPWHEGFAGRYILNNAYVTTFDYFTNAFDEVIDTLNERVFVAKNGSKVA